jgi:hypothetical protein
MGPEEPRRPPDDDETFGYNDPAFDDGTEYSRRAAYSDGPGYNLDAGYSPSAGYFLAEHVVLHDLSDGVPPELVYGAPSPYLHGRA